MSINNSSNQNIAIREPSSNGDQNQGNIAIRESDNGQLSDSIISKEEPTRINECINQQAENSHFKTEKITHLQFH
jgi:hypothetical protein